MPARVLGSIAVASAVSFALLARAVARRDTARVDRTVRKRAVKRDGHPARRVSEAVAPLGKWWTYVPAGAAAAAYVLAASERSGAAGAAAIMFAGCTAAVLNDKFDDALPQPPAPPGRPSITHPVFPSGHALGTTATAMTVAWVLARQELAPAAVVGPLACVLPLVSSGGRMMEDKHWVTDIAGGLLAAIALSATALAAYEAIRDSGARRATPERD
jgi:membrane-associated phospholipid phosphatase